MPIRIADANNGAFSPEEANILSSVFEETIPPRLGLDLKIKDLPLVASGTALKPRGKSMTQVNVRSMADFEPGAMQLTAALNGLPLAPDLKSVLSIVALTRRPSRQPDHAAENGALIALAQKMAFSSEGILQQLAQTALRLCGAHSAGSVCWSQTENDSIGPLSQGNGPSTGAAGRRAIMDRAARFWIAIPHCCSHIRNVILITLPR